METYEQYFARRGYERLRARKHSHAEGWVRDNDNGTRISAIIKKDFLCVAVYRYLYYDRSDKARHQSVFGMADKWLRTPENIGHEINVLTCRANSELQVKMREWEAAKVQEKKDLAQISARTGLIKGKRNRRATR